MSRDYVQVLEGSYRIAHTRVSLDSVVYAYHRGDSPEGIQRSFPALTLEEVYGALAFYLSHKAEVDKYLAEGEQEFAELERSSREQHVEWYERLKRIREETLTSQS